MRYHLLRDTQMLIALIKHLQAPAVMRHAAGDLRLPLQMHTVSALHSMTTSPSGIQCWLKFDSQPYICCDCSGLATPTSYPGGIPIHILHDEERLVHTLNHLHHQRGNRTAMSADKMNLEIAKLRKRGIWGAVFRNHDAVYFGSQGVSLPARWTISVWSLGGKWVQNGRATLCQTTSGDKLVCLDDFGRFGMLKARSQDANPPEKRKHAHWYCCDFPENDREVSESNPSLLQQSQADTKIFADDKGRRSSVGTGAYADNNPDILGKDFEWFHLVVMCTPLQTGSDNEADAELKFFINGIPVRRAPKGLIASGRVCTVGNSIEGNEPWGPMADFRIYFETFAPEGQAGWPPHLVNRPPIFPSISTGKLNVLAVDKTRSWLLYNGVVPALTSLLKHVDDTALISWVCSVLANLSLCPSAPKLIVRQYVQLDEDEVDIHETAQQLQKLHKKRSALMSREVEIRERAMSQHVSTQSDTQALEDLARQQESLSLQIQNIKFAEEWRHQSLRRSLLEVLIDMCASEHPSISDAAQRLLVHLR